MISTSSTAFMPITIASCQITPKGKREKKITARTEKLQITGFHTQNSEIVAQFIYIGHLRPLSLFAFGLYFRRTDLNRFSRAIGIFHRFAFPENHVGAFLPAMRVVNPVKESRYRISF